MRKVQEEDLIKLARQLKGPEGSDGIEMGKSMDEKNREMTMNAIENLQLGDNQSVLELGHGNGGHVKYILGKGEDINYVGLEVSEEMKNQAAKMNRMYLTHEFASFKLYNGIEIPYKDATFERILSVNTIYFWEQPKVLINEIYRVLKPEGICTITFADKAFMENLPFTKYGFELYDISRFESLIGNTNFEIMKVDRKSDRAISKMGQVVKRDYLTAILKK